MLCKVDCRHGVVHELKKDFPGLVVVANGGIADMAEVVVVAAMTMMMMMMMVVVVVVKGECMSFDSVSG